MSAIDDLDPDQRLKYQQFVDIISWEGDPTRPLMLLRSAAWNLEVWLSAFVGCKRGPG